MIDDLFPENKYPSEELFCETARQVLTQRQPERMRQMVQSGQWDAFFRSAISSKVCGDHPDWFLIQKRIF